MLNHINKKWHCRSSTFTRQKSNGSRHSMMFRTDFLFKNCISIILFSNHFPTEYNIFSIYLCKNFAQRLLKTGRVTLNNVHNFTGKDCHESGEMHVCFIALTLDLSLWRYLDTQPSGFKFKQLPQGLAKVNAWKLKQVKKTGL